jgi:hypothetical protein
MLSKILLVLPFALLALGKESYAPLTTGQIYQRQLMTCNQTYGQDSVVCGEADSAFCYNPSAGQVCQVPTVTLCEDDPLMTVAT